MTPDVICMSADALADVKDKLERAQRECENARERNKHATWTLRTEDDIDDAYEELVDAHPEFEQEGEE